MSRSGSPPRSGLEHMSGGSEVAGRGRHRELAARPRGPRQARRVDDGLAALIPPPGHEVRVAPEIGLVEIGGSHFEGGDSEVGTAYEPETLAARPHGPRDLGGVVVDLPASTSLPPRSGSPPRREGRVAPGPAELPSSGHFAAAGGPAEPGVDRPRPRGVPTVSLEWSRWAPPPTSSSTPLPRAGGGGGEVGLCGLAHGARRRGHPRGHQRDREGVLGGRWRRWGGGWSALSEAALLLAVYAGSLFSTRTFQWSLPASGRVGGEGELRRRRGRRR